MNFGASFRISESLATPPPTAHVPEELDAKLKTYMDDLNLLLTCMEGNDSGTLPNNSTEFQPDGGLYTTVAAGNMATHSADLGLGAVPTPDATTSASTSAPARLSFADCSPYTNEFDFLSDLDLSALIMPSPENVNSIPSQLGDQTFSQHADEASGSKIVASSVLRSDLRIPGNSQSEQVSYAPPWDGISLPSPWDDAETSAQVGMSEIMPHWYWLNTVDTNLTAATAIDAFTETPATGGAGRVETALGKRVRTSTSWALDEAEGSRKRVHPMPTTGAQQTEKKYINDVVGRSREALPTTIQGLYHHPLPGPSAPQDMVQSQLQAGGSTEGRDGLFEIPSTLTRRQRLMLRATEEDVRRQAVATFACRLCPTAELGSWQCFQRHCNTIEDHPVELSYCERCGDYFGRRDSLKRHLTKKNSDECRKMPRDEVERKIMKTQELFDEFSMRMEDCLRTGEELGPRFAEIAQEHVQSTSKKPSKSKGTVRR